MSILATLALFATALCLGGMVFFTIAVAPLTHRALPREMAGQFLRRLFPIYYLFVFATAAGAAVALIPLSLWFVFSLACLPGADYEQVRWWVAYPAVAITLVLFIAAALYHSMLGVQVVIEDYVGGEGAKIAALLLSKFFHFAVAAASIFAVLKIALS